MARSRTVARSLAAATLWLAVDAIPGTAPAGPQDPAPAATREDPVPQKAQASADRAVRWLLKAQNADGSFGDNPGMPGEIGNTCIAVLALMSTGSTPTRGAHTRAIQRATTWLDRRARGFGISSEHLDSGTLLQRKLGANIDLYLLTLLGSQLLGNGVDEHDEVRLQGELVGAVERIAAAQQANGEWETSYEPMLTTICAWLALRQASDAGIRIPSASADKVVRYLKQDCFEPASGIFHDAKWGRGVRFVSQSGALRVLYGMGEGGSADVQRATQYLLQMSFDADVGGHEGGEEFLAALFATQALHIERDGNWRAFYPRIVDALVACQNRDGSWVGHHCITGRVFCTSCSILAMLTPHRLLPMVER
ncbi:MAG: hypothetical protein IT457_14730 [Planctomycetes bacterium]|nr:hypothetical protein [Planctomycetota bacterium]